MTVTIKLKPEIEKRLAEKAKENGLKIETYLEVFIENNLKNETESPAEERKKSFSEAATTEEWLTKFHKWIDSHKDKNYPSIPDEALRRENMYED